MKLSGHLGRIILILLLLSKGPSSFSPAFECNRVGVITVLPLLGDGRRVRSGFQRRHDDDRYAATSCSPTFPSAHHHHHHHHHPSFPAKTNRLHYTSYNPRELLHTKGNLRIQKDSWISITFNTHRLARERWAQNRRWQTQQTQTSSSVWRAWLC